MSIEKLKSGKWRTIVRVWLSGKIVEKRGTADTKAGAQALTEQLKYEIRHNGQNCSLTAYKKVSTFSEVVDRYLEKISSLSPSHGRKIEFIKREIGHFYIDEFADRFELWLKLEKKSRRNKNGQVVAGVASPAKINRYVEIVRAAFNVGVAIGIVDKNPITKERFPKQREIARDATLTPDEENSLLNFIDANRPHLSQIVRYSLRVPARKSELVNLKVEDLDLINQRIRIRNERSKTRHGVYKPLPPEMLPYFRNLPADTEYVFFKRDENGKAVSLGDFQRSFKWCLKQIGIDDIRFHDTRHISATKLIDAGTPAEAVKQIAGWSTDMLNTYYSRKEGHALEQVRWEKEGSVKPEGVLKEFKG